MRTLVSTNVKLLQSCIDKAEASIPHPTLSGVYTMASTLYNERRGVYDSLSYTQVMLRVKRGIVHSSLTIGGCNHHRLTPVQTQSVKLERGGTITITIDPSTGTITIKGGQ